VAAETGRMENTRTNAKRKAGILLLLKNMMQLL
jgi:hypothetical protein